MEAIRDEIKEELKRTRLDKTRLYQLLLKIADDGPGGGGRGPAGPMGPIGPVGPEGPPCMCKCSEAAEAPVAKKATPEPAAKPKATKATATKKTVTKKTTPAKK
jgi:hypothetical protein